MGDHAGSPFFFAQVKTTWSKEKAEDRPKKWVGTDRLSVKLGEKDVRKMVESPIPTSLIGVDDPAEDAYIVAIRGDRKTSISSIPRRYPLDGPNLKILYDEVKLHWESLAPLSRRKASAFQM